MALLEGEYRKVSPDEEALAYLPTNDRRYAWLGGLVLLLAFGMFGGWAALAPLESAAVAPAKIEVESASKTIKHLEGGIVSAIKVDSGDRVDKGQILIQLDRTQPRSKLETVRSRLWTAVARKARLEAERKGADEIAFPEALTERSDQPEIAGIMATQRQEFEARRKSLESAISTRRQKIAQLEQQIEGIREQMASERTLLASYDQEVEERRSLLDQEMANKKKLRQAKRRRARIKGKLGQNKAQVAKLKAQIEATRQEIIQLMRQRHKKVVAALNKVKSRILQDKARLQGLRETLRRTRITAPVAGQVVDLRVHTEGGVIKAGQPLMKIVPADDRFEIMARVRPTDIDRVHEGLAADVRFSAYNTIRRKIPGKVVDVSADTVTDEKNQSRYYEARVEITERGIEKMRNLGIAMEPGMPAEVFIKTGEQTLLGYLLNPVTKWLSRSFRESS